MRVGLFLLALVSACSAAPAPERAASPEPATVHAPAPPPAATEQPEPGCGALARVRFSPSMWTAALKRAETLADVNALLAAVRLSALPEPDGSEEPVPEGEAPLSVETARADELRLEPGQKNALLRVEAHTHDGRYRGRLGVLRRLGAHWCALPGELVVDLEPGQRSCLAPDDAVLVVEPLALVSAGHRSLRVETRTGVCGMGTLRGATHELSLWSVTDGELKRLLEVPVFDAYYTSPAPPSRETVGTVTLEGGFPKQVRYRWRLDCTGEAPMPGEEACEQASGERVFAYRGGRYLEASGSAAGGTPQ